jgi:hypothetical protein
MSRIRESSAAWRSLRVGSSGRDLPLEPRKLEREPRSLREEAFREGGEVGTRKDLRLRDSSGLGNGRYIVVAAITRE